MSTTSFNPTLANNLKRLREQLGYTQEFVAKYLDTPREIISFYETGQRGVMAFYLFESNKISEGDYAAI